MFDNLKKAFSNVSTGFSEKDLNEKDIEDVLFELEINLLESDVATEVIDSIKDSLKEKIIGSRVEKKNIQNFVKQSLIAAWEGTLVRSAARTKLGLQANHEAQSRAV